MPARPGRGRSSPAWQDLSERRDPGNGDTIELSNRSDREATSLGKVEREDDVRAVALLGPRDSARLDRQRDDGAAGVSHCLDVARARVERVDRRPVQVGDPVSAHGDLGDVRADGETADPLPGETVKLD